MNANLYPVRSQGVADMPIWCGFATNGASAPTTLFGEEISSVAHTATGVWTVTFKTLAAVTIKHASCHLQLTTATGVFAQCGAYSAAGGVNPTLVINAGTTASGSWALTDVAAATGSNVWIQLVVKNSSVGN